MRKFIGQFCSSPDFHFLFLLLRVIKDKPQTRNKKTKKEEGKVVGGITLATHNVKYGVKPDRQTETEERERERLCSMWKMHAY